MATTLTPNLKLRVNSGLTADAKFNLARIDELGAVYNLDNSGDVTIRAQGNLTFRPEDASLGGAGSGGTIQFGAADQALDLFQVFSDLSLTGGLLLQDTALTSTGSIRLTYKSDASGALDNVERNLTVDVEGADRTLVLGGDVTFLGSLSFTAAAPYSLTVPASGTVTLTDLAQTLTNKTLDASVNTITGLTNSSIDPAAAITYSKLNLTGSLVNADVSPSAAIAYSKLDMSTSVKNSDISPSAAIAYSKLNLSASILNSDVAPSAAIAYSKLNLTSSVTNSDISPSAAISGSKVVPSFGAQNVTTLGHFVLDNSTFTTSLAPAASGQIANITLKLPPNTGTVDQVLRTDGAGNLSWVSIAGSGTVTSVSLAAPAEFTVSGSPVTSSGTLTLGKASQAQSTVFAAPSGSAGEPTFRLLSTSEISEGTNLYYNQGRFDTAFAAKSTTDLTEGTNLYYTDARFDTRLATKSTTDLAEGTNLYYSQGRFDTAFSAKSTTDLAEGTNLYYTTTRFNTDYAARSFKTNWTSGTSFSAVHSLGSRDVRVELYDNTTFETVWVDSVVRTDANTVDLTTSEAPSGAGWRVLISLV